MSPRRKPLVLVVDDTEATRYAIARTLIADGFEAIEAPNGQTALRLAQERQPDLITLDIHLPDMIGFEVCRRLKASPATSRIPVIQVSASYVTSRDRIHGLEGGADSYLTHPFEPAVLIATAKSLLRFRSTSDELARSEQRIRLAVKSTGLGIWEFDVELDVLTWSQRAFEIYGISPEKKVEIGDFIQAVHPDDRERVAKGIRASLDPQEPLERRTEFRIVRGDGAERWLRSTSASLLSDDEPKRVVRVGGTMLDISDRRKVDEDLREAKEAAETANRSKSQFLANVSHEIRTPLGVILGFADLAIEAADAAIAQKSSRDLSEARTSLAVIKRNALELSKLINELLDLSKVEADRMDIERIALPLDALLEEVVSNLKHKAVESGVELRWEGVGALPATIKSDPTRLRQVLMNLLSNALKFTQKGAVVLRARHSVSSVAGEGSRLDLEVEDTGIGLSPTEQQRLFEPFGQADSSTTRRFGGTGLGLMLSRKLARAMGGELVLRWSEKGKGSIFALELVLVDDVADSGHPTERHQALEQARLPGERLRGLRVLLIEDSPDNQMMIKRFLGLAGASVQGAFDAATGMELARNGHYDVVLMDIQMPIMDGYQATQQLRQSGYDRPIFALTAHAMKGERDRCLQAGFTDYLTKPIDREALIQRLSDFARA